MSELAAFGAVLSGGASIFGGIAGQKQANFEADIASQNAGIAQQQAAVEAGRTQRDRSRRLSALRASIGASGTTFSGSNLDALAEEAMEAEEARLTVLFGGEAKARQERLNADAARQRGRASLIGGVGHGVGNLLTGVGKAIAIE